MLSQNPPKHTSIYLHKNRKDYWFHVDCVISGGDVTDTDGPSYASESTAAILMLVFQYVSNGGTYITSFYALYVSNW